MKVLVSAALLAIMVAVASADIITHGPVVMAYEQVLPLWVTEMFSSENAPATTPPGNGRSYVSLDFSVTVGFPEGKTPEPTPGVFIQFLISQHDNLNDIGNATYPAICCTEAIAAKKEMPGCDNPGKINHVVVSPEVLRAHSVWTMDALLPLVGTRNVIQGRWLDLPETGRYFFFAASCHKALETASIELVGTSVWMNPYGYLPGHMYRYMFMYAIVSFCYLGIAVAWLIVNLVYVKELIRLHHAISLVLMMSIVESSVSYFDLLEHNNRGRPTVFLVVLAALGRIIHQTSTRMLLLSVAIGYGIVRPTLGGALPRLIKLSSTYFCVVLARDLVLRFDTSAEIGLGAAVLTVATALLETLFVYWIFVSLYDTLAQLKSRHQLVKLRLYRLVAVTLVIASIYAMGFVVYLMVTNRLGYEAKHWDSHWFVDAGNWQILYGVVLLFVAFVFRPTSNSKRYEYTQMADLHGTSVDPEDLELNHIEEGAAGQGYGAPELVPELGEDPLELAGGPPRFLVQTDDEGGASERGTAFGGTHSAGGSTSDDHLGRNGRNGEGRSVLSRGTPPGSRRR